MGKRTTVRIMTPQGTMENREGEVIDLSTVEENWNIYQLTDGTEVKLKQSLVQIIRFDDIRDMVGNPTYVVQTSPIIVVNVPPQLRKT